MIINNHYITKEENKFILDYTKTNEIYVRQIYIKIKDLIILI